MLWALGAGLAAISALAWRAPDDPPGAAASAVDFADEVRPILVRSCLACHGFDPSTREAGLRLDSYEHATTAREGGGRAAIVPGQPDRSLLIDLVTSSDPRERMPAEGEPLTPAEVEILRRWIAQGASYERHWSLEPVEPARPPEVADAAWAEHPIDAFVRARLDQAGLAPAAAADRRTLIRRLAFDLTGLPPTPEEVRAFERDDSPEAYAQLVDRLLASPAFGERWARHWLDLVRYAETYAHEFDYAIRHASGYRDWVIRAFNADVAYDQFVTEQIAGDLMPEPRLHPAEGYNESIIGTGFWWLSEGTHAPVDVRLDEAVRIENQIDVFSKAFLATTVSCARCHDHKFDPIYTKEFYSLAGFLQSSRRQEAYLDPGGRIRSAIDEMQSIDARVRTHIERESTPVRDARLAGVDRSLLAASAVLDGSPVGDESAPEPSTRAIGRFDGPDFTGWTVTGDSFGDAPDPVGDHPLQSERTARGAGFANGHRRAPDGSSPAADKRTGRLVSDEFVIDHDFLHFLIGGGNHPDLTGLRVLVDGEPVRRATGHNSLHLRAERFDLSAFRGRTATVEIFDHATEGWGNIRVDEIILSDQPSLDRLPRRPIDAVAHEAGVDPGELAQWVRALQETNPADGTDLLALWLGASAAAGGDPSGPVDGYLAGLAARAVDPWVRTALFTFGAGRPAGWFESGWAFAGGTHAPGEPRQPARGGGIITEPCVDSGTLSDRLMGTLRSPTFEITDPYLAVRASGRGVIRVIIDGYTMDEYNALIFDRVRLEVDSTDWRWHVHDLRKYVGHRAHYEIIDDRTDGSIAVSGAVFLAEDRPPTDAGWSGELRLAADGLSSLAELAALFGERARAAASGEPSPLDAAVLVALERHGLLSEPSDELWELRASFAEAEALCPEPMRALAMEDGTPEDEFVFIRGNPATLGERAPRGFIGVLVDDPTIDGSTGSGRLELAAKLFDQSNPLPARVMVNRVWHHLFGRGLVETTDDFGLLGASPTHPQLLDHLAHRFAGEMNWSIKTLIREIVLSNTYRMASEPASSRAAEVDPRNLLWSTRTPRRLEGETIRDAVLAVSGRLDPSMFGPSVPVHLTPFMTGRGRPGRSGPVDGDGRRSIYLEVRRNFLDPMMQAFDAPVPHGPMGKRPRSNVPAQSLILMNSPMMTGQAQLFAARAASEAEDADGRLDRMYLLALSRPPTEAERHAARAFLAQQAELRAVEQGSSASDADSAAWADLAHVLFNLKEFVFIE